MSPDFDVDLFIIGLVMGGILGMIKAFTRLVVHVLVLALLGVLLLAATGSLPEWTNEGKEFLEPILAHLPLAAGVVAGFILALVVRSQNNK